MKNISFVFVGILVFFSSINCCAADFKFIAKNIIQEIHRREKELHLRADKNSRLEKGKDASAFTSVVKVPAKKNQSAIEISYRTIFDDTADTVKKRSQLHIGQMKISFVSVLDNEHFPFEQIDYSQGRDR